MGRRGAARRRSDPTVRCCLARWHPEYQGAHSIRAAEAPLSSGLPGGGCPEAAAAIVAASAAAPPEAAAAAEVLATAAALAAAAAAIIASRVFGGDGLQPISREM